MAFGKMLKSWLGLFGFRCVFILLAVAERDGGSLQSSHLKQKTDDTGARYGYMIWPCVLIIMIIK